MLFPTIDFALFFAVAFTVNWLLNPYAGYLCVIADLDGHMVEFSYGQALGRSPVYHEIGKAAP